MTGMAGLVAESLLPFPEQVNKNRAGVIADCRVQIFDWHGAE